MTSNYDLTKDEIVPYNLTIEKVILTEIFLSKKNSNTIFHKIEVHFFYSQKHQFLFKAAKELYEEEVEVNIDTVADRLRLLGSLEAAGGVEEIIRLINNSNNITNIETYIVLLVDKYVRRQIIDGSKKIYQLAYQSFDSIENLFDKAEEILLSITQKKTNNDLLLTSEVLLETFVDLEKRSAINQYLGIKTGFFDLDEITHGFQKSDLIILAGRPSMGKTAFALNLVRNISELQDSPILIFSLEMSRQQLIYRFLSKESQVIHSKLRMGNINQREWYSVSKAVKSLANLKIYLDDTPNVSLISLKNKINSLKLKYGNIGLIVLDYLQLLNDPKNKDSRVQELSRLTRGIKILAKEFETPILVLSQLSRSVESRVNKRPVLSDLRESGCIGSNMNIYISYSNMYLNIQRFIAKRENEYILTGIKKAGKKSTSVNLSSLKRGYFTGLKLGYSLTMLNGTFLNITANHNLLTLEGWKQVKDLNPLDLISILDINNFSKKRYCLKNEGNRIHPKVSLMCLTDISIIGTIPCYDLWVPSNNNYVVNTILVHNSIEQDADLVLMLYRDSYYNDESNSDDNDITEVIITKHRNGSIGTINILFEPKTLTFENFVF